MSIQCQFEEFSFSEKTNEKSQSPTTDQSMAKHGRDTDTDSHTTARTLFKVKQPALSSS